MKANSSSQAERYFTRYLLIAITLNANIANFRLSGHVKCSSDNSTEIDPTKSARPLAQFSELIEKYESFPMKTSHRKKFQWTRRMQF